ncbi:MAG: glycosyltransferase family 2 protein [Prevotella sp.]|nr:glycosyltransferase family 2 protein [Prevotella sp.]
MTQNRPTLSIIMPVFNRTELVATMIDSILANSFTDYELIAVDDGSDQDTLDMLSCYQKKDQRIKIICRTEQPKGATKCRNIGLDHAQGEYVIFFDSDDIITPSCLSERVNSIRQRPDMDFLVFPSCTFYNNILHPLDSKFVYGYKLHDDDISYFCQRLLPFVVVNNIYKTKSLKENNIRWDEQLKSLQDCDFNLQSILKGLKYDYVSVYPDYGYRIDERGNAVSAGITTKKHYASNLHSICKLYQMVQGKYGHKYDRDLYKGVLYTFNLIMTNGIDYDFTDKLAKLVKSRSPKYGRLLSIRFQICKLLGCFMSSRHSRQLPMASYILGRLYTEKKLENRISCMIKK